MEHGAWSMGHGAWGMEHRAWSMGHGEEQEKEGVMEAEVCRYARMGVWEWRNSGIKEFRELGIGVLWDLRGKG